MQVNPTSKSFSEIAKGFEGAAPDQHIRGKVGESGEKTLYIHNKAGNSTWEAIKDFFSGRSARRQEGLRTIKDAITKEYGEGLADRALTNIGLQNTRGIRGSDLTKLHTEVEKLKQDAIAKEVAINFMKSHVTQFREVDCFGVKIGGSARPWGEYVHGQSSDEVFKTIRKAGYENLLSIDQDGRDKVPPGATWQMKPELEQYNQKAGTDLRLNHIMESDYGVEDFGIPDNGMIDKLAQTLKESGGKTLLHCGAGAGRTGTVLAALLIRSLVEERARANDLSELRAEVASGSRDNVRLNQKYTEDELKLCKEENINPEAERHLKRDSEGVVVSEAYPTVARVIRELREADQGATFRDKDSGSVELGIQVRFLNDYLAHCVDK